MPERDDTQSSMKFSRVTGQGGESCLLLTGSCTLSALGRRMSDLSDELTSYASDPHLHWDLTKIDQMDDAGAVLLWRSWGASRPEHLSVRPEQERLFSRLGKTPPLPSLPKKEPLWLVSRVGGGAILLWEHLTSIVILAGQLLLDMKYLMAHPARTPWREISANLFRTGAQALGITALVGFLIGVVLSYLSSKQLQMFGADIFIINILGMSIICLLYTSPSPRD